MTTPEARSSNLKRKTLYKEAVTNFEKKKKGKSTANELDRLWNEAGEEALSSAPQSGRAKRMVERAPMRPSKEALAPDPHHNGMVLFV